MRPGSLSFNVYLNERKNILHFQNIFSWWNKTAQSILYMRIKFGSRSLFPQETASKWFTASIHEQHWWLTRSSPPSLKPLPPTNSASFPGSWSIGDFQTAIMIHARPKLMIITNQDRKIESKFKLAMDWWRYYRMIDHHEVIANLNIAHK